MTRSRLPVSTFILFLLVLAVPLPLQSVGPAPGSAVIPTDLTTMSLEQLATLQVTSVSRKPQRETTAPAAVYVITRQDIHRSGVGTLAEALRLAPGVEVARINANQWAVGIRGFGSRLSRSVLVLIDGRSVYSPLFAGTYWEVQDTLIEDVERIEIIRGPGGTLWGANAVNGVINIITRHSRDTKGLYAVGGMGTSIRRGSLGARYGGQIGKGHFRVYGKYFDRGSTFSRVGSRYDSWNMGQSGFRSDWELDASNTLTVQGDAYGGRAGARTTVAIYTSPFSQTIERDSNLNGQNLLGRWTHRIGPRSDVSVQTYYDRTYRKDPNFLETRHTYDLELQHRFQPFFRHDVVWGSQYRVTSNDTDSPPTVAFTPDGRTDHLAAFFAQDEIELVPEKWRMTLGTKVEHNDFSGWEVQPNGRLAWTPVDNQTAWAAASRAVRTPSALEHDLALTANLVPGSPTFARLMGNPGFASEKVNAYELGYRIQPVLPLAIDVATFYNDYDDLLGVEPGTSFTETGPSGARTIIPYMLTNGIEGHTKGIELANTWFVRPGWNLKAQYSFLQMNLRATGTDTTSVRSLEGSSPNHQVLLQSSHEFLYGIEFDPTARFIDALPAQGVPAYWNLDLRLAWHATRHIEIALIGRGLLQPQHREFGSTNEIPRTYGGQLVWRAW